ncbi:FxsA family protein [Neisseria sicca]|uniref:FxsA family protein n=1 Tax=Neisseria sicca TaxID=490 RepID=UPI0002FB3B31|nr:FxsA family protein [Neisseria sicca]
MQFFGIGFLVLIFLEIMSIVWVADWLGGSVALLLMVLSFVCGLLMLRNTGLSGILLAGATIRSGGKVSLYQMLWPMRYAVAAVCLMSPGFISTGLALLLFVPFKGRTVVQVDMDGNMFGQRPFSTKAQDNDVIEGEYTVTSEDSDTKHQAYIEHKKD